MAVKLRLRRMGKIRQPIYKVVAADARSPRDGRFIDAIGSYNPHANPAQVNIDEEKVMYWLGVGAQPTTTVKRLLSKEGILFKRRLMKSGISEEDATARVDAWKQDKQNKLDAVAAQKAAEVAKQKAAEEKAKKEAEEAERKAAEEQAKKEAEEAAKKAEEEAAAAAEAENAKAEDSATEENSEEEK